MKIKILKNIIIKKEIVTFFKNQRYKKKFKNFNKHENIIFLCPHPHRYDKMM